MAADDLLDRVKRFAVDIVRFANQLPRSPAIDELARQLARSGPSVSANYHSARRGRSRREFVARLGVVADEADETVGWLETLEGAGVGASAERGRLLAEARELRAIFAKSCRTARLNLRGT